MTDEFEVDRAALIDLHRLQNLDALVQVVAEGGLTQNEAAKVHEAYMASEVLQTLVAIDVATLEAMLSGQVH